MTLDTSFIVPRADADGNGGLGKWSWSRDNDDAAIFTVIMV